jgi:hypothetical protein
MTWGRLTRYAGQDGKCYPAVPTLAKEIGLSSRQTQRYLKELETKLFIRRIGRFIGKMHTSNAYEFLGHPAFLEVVTDTSPRVVSQVSPGVVTDVSPKESPFEESPSKETTDLDYQPTNRKKRDSRSGPKSSPVTPSACKQYPAIREALALYMMANRRDEKIYPQPRIIVEIMDAARGATELDVINCLRFLRDERGLRYGTKNGPRSFAWFPKVVGDYFKRQRERSEPPSPTNDPSRLNPAEFNFMTEAIEV